MKAKLLLTLFVFSFCLSMTSCVTRRHHHPGPPPPHKEVPPGHHHKEIPPGHAKKIYRDKSAKDHAPGHNKHKHK